MTSGIGSGALLASHKIPVVVDNPLVGSNLQDHPIFCLIGLLKDKKDSLDYLNSFPANAMAFFEYLMKHDNELAKAAEMTGYFQSDTAGRLGELPPDLQIAFIKCLYVNHGQGGGDRSRPGFALGPVLMAPKSKGMVTLADVKKGKAGMSSSSLHPSLS